MSTRNAPGVAGGNAIENTTVTGHATPIVCTRGWVIVQLSPSQTLFDVAHCGIRREFLVTRSVSEEFGRRHNSAPRLRFGLRCQSPLVKSATSKLTLRVTMSVLRTMGGNSGSTLDDDVER
jgi:hypothetical protein